MKTRPGGWSDKVLHLCIVYMRYYASSEIHVQLLTLRVVQVLQDTNRVLS